MSVGFKSDNRSYHTISYIRTTFLLKQFYLIINHLPIAARFATIDLARAFPTDNCVFGSLFGGGGG